MLRDDVEKLIGWLHDAFPRLTVEQVALYSSLLEKEQDTAAASRAVLRLIKTCKYPPAYAELHEIILAEKKLAEPDREHKPTLVKFDRTMPNYMRRYVCARYLYATFGREQDMRPFPEEYPGGAPPDVDLMPEGEWEQEAATIDMATAWKALLAGGDR